MRGCVGVHECECVSTGMGVCVCVKNRVVYFEWLVRSVYDYSSSRPECSLDTLTFFFFFFLPRYDGGIFAI